MRRYAILVLLALLAGPLHAADSITVAVASNFNRAAADIAAEFTAATGIAVRRVTGSTGKLYAQIEHGAPFDVFLAADAERSAGLEASGRAVAGSRFTYATGALVLWSRDRNDCLAVLAANVVGRVALANPDIAPYGRAAKEFLVSTGYWDSVSRRAVYGENIMQALQFTVTGNAALGIIARSQLSDPNLPDAACTWDVPAATYAAIDQQAVLLSRAADNENARRFIGFMQSATARAIIARHGYGLAP